MNVRVASLAAAAALTLSVWACGSDNPARPSMSFAAPIAQVPANGVAYNFAQQPIQLQIVNSVTTGSKPVVYQVELAADSGFANVVFSRDDIAQGGDGTTSVSLPALEGNRTYFWRWRAVVDGIAGEASTAQSFFLRPNVVINTPAVRDPDNGATVFAARPVFSVLNATRTGPAGTIFYEFQVSDSTGFGTILQSGTVQEQQNQTSWTPTGDLPEGTLFWRVRATDPANDVQSPFSASIQFERRFGIDLKKVVYIQGPDISDWPQTAHITAAYKVGDVVCSEFEGGNWPNAPFLGDPSVAVIGNQWIFANVGGIWYGGAGHWLRPGQFCKSEYDDAFFVDAFHNPPFSSLVLHSGDVFGIAVSTPARFYPADKTVDERTDVAMVVW